jgi:post-segregation antitoxin (ccd killing protein)
MRRVHDRDSAPISRVAVVYRYPTYTEYDKSMTTRVTVTLPDDVAESLKGLANVSAYVTEALRAKIETESLREMMARHGIRVTVDGSSHARTFLARRRNELGIGLESDEAAA